MNWGKSVSKKSCEFECSVRRPNCLSVGKELSAVHEILSGSGMARVLLKAQGLSVLKRSGIGCLSRHCGRFVDALSGLSFSDTAYELIAFGCPVTRCFRIAVMTGGQEILAYMSFEAIPWRSSEAEKLKEKLCCKERNVPSGCTSGCRRWLDDWSQLARVKPRSFEREELVASMSASCLVNLRMQVKGLRMDSQLTPEIVDVDGNVVRISDSRRQQVIYAEMGSVDFSFEDDVVVLSN